MTEWVRNLYNKYAGRQEFNKPSYDELLAEYMHLIILLRLSESTNKELTYSLKEVTAKYKIAERLHYQLSLTYAQQSDELTKLRRTFDCEGSPAGMPLKNN